MTRFSPPEIQGLLASLLKYLSRLAEKNSGCREKSQEWGRIFTMSDGFLRGNDLNFVWFFVMGEMFLNRRVNKLNDSGSKDLDNCHSWFLEQNDL